MIFLDAGDMLYPRKKTKGVSREYLDSRARFMIKALGKMGLQVWTPSELDMGLDLAELQRLAKESGIELLASNLSCAKKPDCMSTMVKLRSGGLVIGLIGLVGKRGKLPPGLKIKDPIEAARDKVKTLSMTSERADLIIALSNMGLDADRKLAQQVDGIDFIIGAGDDRMILVPRAVGESLLLQPYKLGEYLGLMDLKIDHLPHGRLVDKLEIMRTRRALQEGRGDETKLKKKLASYKGANIFRAALRPLSADIKDEPSLAKMVEDQLSAEAGLP